MYVKNANAVLQRHLPGWNINLSAKNLILQDPSGRHMITLPKLIFKSILTAIRYIISLAKKRFVLPVVIEYTDWRGTSVHFTQRRFPVRAVRIGHDGTLWLGLAYHGLLWRKGSAYYE